MKKTIRLITTLTMLLSSNIKSMGFWSEPTVSISSIPQRTSTQEWKQFVVHPAANWLLKRYAQHHRGLPCYILEGHHGRLTYVLFNKNGNLLFSGARNGAVLVWNVATGKLIKVLAKFDSGIYALGLDPKDPQDKYLYVLCQNAKEPDIHISDHVYAINNTALQFKVNIESRNIKRLYDSDESPQSYIPDPFKTRYLSTDLSSPMATLVDREGNSLVTFNSHSDVIPAVAFDSHGSLLATGSADKKICLWNLSLGLSSQLTKAQAELLIMIYNTSSQEQSTLDLTGDADFVSTFRSLPRRIQAALEDLVTLPAVSQQPTVPSQTPIQPQSAARSFWPSWQTVTGVTSILAGATLIGFTILKHFYKR